MSAVLEFAIEPDEFVLGRALSRTPGIELELERVVPTTRAVVPFVRATGEDLRTFEDVVRRSRHVRALSVVDRADSSALYRLRWDEYDDDLVVGITESEATVLEGRATDVWTFRLRFPDSAGLTRFHDYVRDHDIPIRVERTDTGAGAATRDRRFDLSPEQREALELALRRGYFATPSEVALDELAAELGISRQALSDRIRRGNETVLRRALAEHQLDRD